MGSPGFKIDIFADGANQEEMIQQYKKGVVRGFTTNPTLMAKSGIKDYERFARGVLETITDLPISFEVFSDEFPEMKRQAHKIAEWGKNVNVKIPITNTKRESAIPLIKDLLADGVKLNVTAILALDQVRALAAAVGPKDDVIVSVFAGRVADTGVDPVPLMRDSARAFAKHPGSRVLWASPREVLNVYQAEECGCRIITATEDVLKKLSLRAKDLSDYSLDTVKMFYEDARKAGFRL